MKNNKIIIGILVGVAIIGVAGFFFLREPEKPTLEEANVILEESIEKTLGLASFTTIGDANFQIKDGETVVYGVTMRDTEMSIINPFDFTNQDLRMSIVYDIVINLEAIADLIKAGMSSEELDEMKAGMMGMDPLEMMRGVGEANISVTMEMKSIDFDSYMKIVEVTGLREIAMQAGGVFAADMVMGMIEPKMDVWVKTPADPEMEGKMMEMSEKIKKLILPLFDTYYVREVLPNTEVEGVSVYNFALGIDLEKIKEVVISFIPFIAEKAEIEINEKEIITAIEENWPKVVEAIGAMKMDSRIYICQETRFTIKETGTANMNLYELMTILEPTITAEMTQEEIIKLERIKEALRDISFVATMDFVYSDHNAVPAIMSPTEYQILE